MIRKIKKPLFKHSRDKDFVWLVADLYCLNLNKATDRQLARDLVLASYN